jgi:hypothetical protein
MTARQHDHMPISLGLDESWEIAERALFEPVEAAYSGARFERVVLADGRRLVLKRLPPEGDWLTRVTGGAGRTRLLWDSGILGEVAATVEHGMLALVRSEGADVVVMRDLADVLLPLGTVLSVTEVRRLLAGLAALHRTWEGRHVDGLCPPEVRYRQNAPSMQRADRGPNPHPARELILAGWEAFAELVPAEIAEAVFAVHEHPEALAEALMASAPATLVHGDARLENFGLDGDRLVAIDWGELTGIGPAAIDITRFAITNGWRIDATPGEVFAAYEEQARCPLEPAALDLACIGALAQIGWKLATLSRTQDEPTGAQSSSLLAWWVDRVRGALQTWSPR